MAYNTLTAAADPDATPIIILLSDGAPTYYYTNLMNFRTGTTDRVGDGTATSSTYAAYTIAQAAYFKVKMAGLQIYTVPFSLSSSDSDYNIEQATLNPTDDNVARLSSFTSNWNTALSKITVASDKALVKRYYPDATYSASNSSASLATALNNIITAMNIKTPIQETQVEGLLDDASYIWTTYSIGKGYKLLNNMMTVTLDGTAYTFNRSGSAFIYSDLPTSPTYNEKMNRIIIAISPNGSIVWQIPANVLPCNTPEGAGQGSDNTDFITVLCHI